jgi:hypothetical protein
MSVHSLTKKFIEYRHIDTKNMKAFWPIYREFEKLVAEYGDEFTEYLLNDTIAWAVGGNPFYSPKFLWYRVNQVKPKFEADKKALEEKQEQEEIQTAFVLRKQKEFLEDDLSQFE